VIVARRTTERHWWAEAASTRWAPERQIVESDESVSPQVASRSQEIETAALVAGALGYVTKQRLSMDLEHAVREAHAGCRFVPQQPARPAPF
jgi:DNA-binding NarL/FixJ family response regulator